MGSVRLFSEVVPAHALPDGQVEALYRLYRQHFDGTDPERFRADLEEKRWVILLREESGGMPIGFSTQTLMEVCVDGRPVTALFSGDTIIDRAYWGSAELVRAWCRLAGQLKAQCGDEPLYWFLISKGHRTYLYLPLFFYEFYPRCDRPTPEREARLLRTLASERYPEAFDPRTGLIEFDGEHDRLKPELDAAPRRERNPHVAFFLRKNPNYARGSELACLAEIAPANVRPGVRGELEAGLAASQELPG
jgi:hypothetical protein